MGLAKGSSSTARVITSTTAATGAHPHAPTRHGLSAARVRHVALAASVCFLLYAVVNSGHLAARIPPWGPSDADHHHRAHQYAQEVQPQSSLGDSTSGGGSDLHRDVRVAEAAYKRIFAPAEEGDTATGAAAAASRREDDDESSAQSDDDDHERRTPTVGQAGSTDVFGFPLALYDDQRSCGPRRASVVAARMISSGSSSSTANNPRERETPAAHLLRCPPRRNGDGNGDGVDDELLSSSGDAASPSSGGDSGRSSGTKVVPWEAGVDRWAHPYVLQRDTAGSAGEDNPDNAVADNTDSLAVGPSTYFSRHPMNTKVVRNVLYFRRVKQQGPLQLGTLDGSADADAVGNDATLVTGEDRHAQDGAGSDAVADEAALDKPTGNEDSGGQPTTPAPTLAGVRIQRLEQKQKQTGTGTGDSSKNAEAASIASDAPNDVTERFVVASLDGYHVDRALYRRYTDAEAHRAIAHWTKLKKREDKRRAREGVAPAREMVDGGDDETAAHREHLDQVDSNFVKRRGTLGFFASAAAIAARAPDPLTLGDGLGNQDVSVVDTARFMRLLNRTTPTPWMSVGDHGAVNRDAALPAENVVPLAFLVNVRTCLANHWHGTTEVALPLLALLLRHSAISTQGDSSSAVPIFVRAPSRAVWGMYNKGCPTLNQWPYGSSTAASWILRAIAPNIVFVDERGDQRRRLEQRPVQPLNASVAIGRLVVSGLDYTCGGAFDPLSFYTVTSRWDRSTTPPIEAYPFMLVDSHRCDDFLDVSRRVITQRQRATATALSEKARNRGDAEGVETIERALRATGDGALDRWLGPRDAACPVVVLLFRQGSTNGRHIDNILAVRTAIEEFVAAAVAANECPELTGGRVRDLHLHHLDPIEQLAELSQATVLVAMRGAATIAALFARPGAAIVTLTPVHFSVPLSYRNDNVPWWPFFTLRKDVAIAMGICRAVPIKDEPRGGDTPAGHYSNLCRKRSVNFCNAVCDGAHVTEILASAVAAQRELTYEAVLFAHAWKTIRASNTDDHEAERKMRREPVAFTTFVEGNVAVAVASRATRAVLDGVQLWALPDLQRRAAGAAKESSGSKAIKTVVKRISGEKVDAEELARDAAFARASRRSQGRGAAGSGTTADGGEGLAQQLTPDALDAELQRRRDAASRRLQRQLQSRDDRHTAGEASIDYPQRLVTVIAPDVTPAPKSPGASTSTDVFFVPLQQQQQQQQSSS